MNENLGFEQPRTALCVVANQKQYQWVNNNDFYKLIPAPYYQFYNSWVRLWLQWFDGCVPQIHGSANGLLSTSIGTVIVNRAADSVFGGNIMFANARTPTLRMTTSDGKTVGKALDFISNDWSASVDLKAKFKLSIRNALAGGFSIMKLNVQGGELWVDSLRADRFYIDKTGRGEIRRCVSILNFFDSVTNKTKDQKRYALIEDRYFESYGIFEEEIPVVEYKIYDTSAQIQYISVNDNFVKYEELPKDVRSAFKSQYSFELNKPQYIKGFKSLGVYLFKGSDDISNVPQFGLGESLLANVLTYLYEYDFYNTCFNTDMYLARGRVLVPKFMQSPTAASGNQNAGLDDFLYTKIESSNPDMVKPEPIQFALRSAEWKEARNMLLECIATGIGFSVSTLASYLNDGSNRTAREVSAEESATTLFIENARRRFETPMNDLIKDVLRYYGYVDDVEVRWSKSGMTNLSVLVDNLSKAVTTGLISQKKAHDLFNYDDDEEQNAEDFALVEQEQANKQNSLFGEL